MAKHFIRINENDEVIKAYSDELSPEEFDINDICINEFGARCFVLEIYKMTNLQDIKYKFKYINGELVENEG